MRFIKATLIGGVAFLVPVVVLLMVLGKAFEIMSRLAAPVQRFLPLQPVGGIAAADLVAVVAIVLVCFVAGLFAMSGFARRFYHRIDGVLMLLPGAPNPWSGSLLQVASDRVETLAMTVQEAVSHIRGLGPGRTTGKGENKK